MSTLPPPTLPPLVTTDKRPLKVIFKWAFIIFALLGLITLPIIDAVINGLIWGGIIVGLVALWRKVRR